MENKIFEREVFKSEIRKVIERFRSTQGQLQILLKESAWAKDARKFAERQSREMRRVLNADMDRVLAFIHRERKELEKIQKRIPNEVERIKKYVAGQSQELSKLLEQVRAKAVKAAPKKKSSGAAKKKSVSKKKKSAESASAHA